jgi:hypothetical protein
LLAERHAEEIVERAEIEVLLRKAKDGLAAFAVERFHDDVAVLGAERLDLGEVAGDQRRRHQIRKLHHEHLFRRVADLRRLVDDQGRGADALEQMGRGDIGQVERRVLPQQDDIEALKRHALGLAQLEMVAFVVAHGERPHGGKNLVAAQRQAVRRVVRKLVTAPLCFQQQCKSRVAADIDPLDRIHLHGDFQAHRFSSDTTW